MEGDDTVETETGIGIGDGETELRSVGHVESVARAVGFGADGKPGDSFMAEILRLLGANGAALRSEWQVFCGGKPRAPSGVTVPQWPRKRYLLGWRVKRTSKMRRKAPMVIAESATLKAGQR